VVWVLIYGVYPDPGAGNIEEKNPANGFIIYLMKHERIIFRIREQVQKTIMKKPSITRCLLCSAAFVVAITTGTTGKADDTASSPPKADSRMEWFRQAKFGMFIHWGVYAVPAGKWKGKDSHGEWIQLTGKIPNKEYEEFPKQFNPVKFDGKEWAGIAKQAGMKYMVITAKHHDGFCMYDSKETEYDIVQGSPYGKDPMKSLSKACRDAGMTFCFYYSTVDWHHPEYPAKYSQREFHGNPNPEANMAKYADYMHAQVKELLTDYGPIGLMWFDGGGSLKKNPRKAELLKGKSLVKMMHKIQPNCLINNRLGYGEDYGTPEQHIPKGMLNKPFEVCMTLNKHWGYNQADDHWKSAKTILHNLADISHKGGNYLLNVGPTAEGKIPEESVRILEKVGRWMAMNSDSIYGTTRSIYPDIPAWGRITTKEKQLYLHVFKRPKDGIIHLPAGTRAILSGRLLAAPQTQVQVTHQGEEFLVKLPETLPDLVNTVVVLQTR